MTAFNKANGMPPWLQKPMESYANKNTQRGWRYYRHLWNAQPDWANVGAIRAIYRECKRRRKAGENVEVDHIYPLQGHDVCGLHVPANLHIIDAKVNGSHSNRTHPGNMQADLFENSHASVYFELTSG